jgi:Penicillin binding protein transpeptidase domain/NTF2-like N-terminal transpeptidase domain
MPGQHDERWALDEHGVWRKQRGITGDGTPRPRHGVSRKQRGITGDGTPRPRWKLGVVGGIGVAAVVALAAVLILGPAGLFGSTKANTGGFHPTVTTPAQAARQTAEAFLAAWEAGHIQKAASYTDHPVAAAAALTSYRDGLHLRALHLAVRSATAKGRVAFWVDATVGLSATTMPGATVHSTVSSLAGRTSDAAATATWSYASDLTTYAKNGAWWVRWNPGLVAPSLTAREKVVTAPIAAGAGEVVNAAGGNLQDSGDPGLINIAAALRSRAPAGQGTPGIEAMLVGPGNKPVAGTTDIVSQPVAASVVKTTIDPGVEAAAMSAVQAHADSSMVVIQPSTGEVLAVANNDGGNDFALTARVAPGSTNKIITSTALFTTGLVRSPSQPVECPSQVDADGEVINNAGGESEPPGTPFLTDFAASCNNAFDRWYASMGPATLAQTAQKYYGLNEPWNIGIGQSAPYYTIPSSASDAELALELFGQGRLETAPLAMASVAATVDTGSFQQPIVVAGQPQLAATPLPVTVRQYLWQMMRAVTQSGGTAAGVFGGVSSAVYAKTGTADVGGQSQPNSWMVAFDPTLNVAIGCVVLNAGYGAQVAGPEAATVFQLLSQRG